jgi:HSP20 family molecular chaperone IbpA
MRTYDFSPLFRSTIGFDRLFDLAEAAQRATEEGHPPYNIERLGEDRYQTTLAVAGFSPEEISITAEQNVVTIEGGKAERPNVSSFTGASRTDISSVSLTSRTTSKSKAPPLTTAC